jgi:hypothetical protein
LVIPGIVKNPNVPISIDPAIMNKTRQKTSLVKANTNSIKRQTKSKQS